ncbi:MAG TPA: hypothetical protein VK079_02805 [Bacillota bacterium]|nr:hypothetical protein [Bacillota bacterium]
MIRLLFYLMGLTIVFLFGLVIGLGREMEEQQFVNDEEVTEAEFVNEQTLETSWQDYPEPTQAFVEEDERLIQKFASLCESVVHGFYQMVVQILYQFSKLFI